MLTTLLFAQEVKFVLKIEIILRREYNGFFPLKQTNKEALTVPCSVMKHFGSGLSTQELVRNTRRVHLVFHYTSFVLYRLLRAFQENRAQ